MKLHNLLENKFEGLCMDVMGGWQINANHVCITDVPASITDQQWIDLFKLSFDDVSYGYNRNNLREGILSINFCGTDFAVYRPSSKPQRSVNMSWKEFVTRCKCVYFDSNDFVSNDFE